MDHCDGELEDESDGHGRHQHQSQQKSVEMMEKRVQEK